MSCAPACSSGSGTPIRTPLPSDKSSMDAEQRRIFFRRHQITILGLLKFDIKFCTDQLSGLFCVTDAMWSVVAAVTRKEGRKLARVAKSRHTHALGLLKSKPKLMLYIASRYPKQEGVRRTRYSSVFGMSRIDFTPDAITATGVRLNSVKSALTSSATKNPFNRCKKLVFVRYSCELLVTCCKLTFVVVSVHTSDTSRHEHTDACSMRKKHGRTHCCSTTQALYKIRTPIDCGK